MTEPKLTPKQTLFVQEYLIDLNATKAAIRAGYSENTAYSIGSENLSKPEIQECIQKAMEERSKRTGITQDRVLEELAHIGFLDIRKAFGEDGNLLPIHEMPEEVARAIGGFEIDATKASRHEDDDEFTQTKKVKLIDKKGSLELMGKHLKMFSDKVEVTGADGKDLVPEMDPTDIARRIAFALSKAVKEQ